MPTENPERDGFWMFALSFIGSPSSELFLALSGTVLLPVKTGFRQFYKRRFLKLLPPLVIWSVLGVLLYTQTHGMPTSEAVTKILHIPFVPAIGVYWFVYAMAGLYLFAPFISPWLHGSSMRQIEFFLLLWGVNMTIPWIQYFWPGFIPGFDMTGNYYWELSLFGGFLGYWLLGYYLNRYPIAIGLNVKWMGLLTLTLAYPLAIAWIKIRGGEVDVLVDNLQIGSGCLVAMLYVAVRQIKVPEGIQKGLSTIAKYSFGIYLTHIYIARDLYWGLFDGSTIHIFPRTLIIALLTLLTGYLLTWMLSKVPKGKYITGV